MKQPYSDQITSFDIETTGLTPARNSVLWSAGFYNGKEQEEILTHNSLTQGKDLGEMFTEAKKNSLFQKSQIEKGAYKEYTKTFKKGGLQDEQYLVEQFIRHISSPSILLMQNANFENIWMSNMLTRHPESQERVRNLMEFTTPGNDKFFYTPPKVSESRWAANKTYQEMFDTYRSGGNLGSDLQKYANQRSETIGEYIKLFNDPDRRGTVVAELMDFTKAVFAQGAAQKYIPKEALFTSVANVEYLSQVLLGEKESHTAASDAKQQYDIFHKLIKMHGELESGNVSDETKTYLDKFAKTSPFTSEVSYLTSLHQGLEETKNQGYYNVRDRFEMEKYPHKIKSLTYGDMIINAPTTKPKGQYSIGQYNEIIKNIGSRFKNTKADSVREDIESNKYPTIDDAIQDIYNKLGPAKERLSDVIKNNGPIETKESISKAFNLGTKTKVAAAVGLTAVGLYMLSGPSKKEKEKKDGLSQQLAAQNNVPNAVFNAYGYNRQQPVVFSGTGFYNWENRTGHHRA